MWMSCSTVRDSAERAHLHPRVALHLVDRPQLEPQPGHQEVGLVAGFALQRDELIALRPGAEPLGHEPHLGRTDRVEAAQHHDQEDEQDDGHRDGHDDRSIHR